MTTSQYMAQKALEYEAEFLPERGATPLRMRRRRWSKTSRDAARQRNTKVTGNAGIHCRRNKRVNW